MIECVVLNYVGLLTITKGYEVQARTMPGVVGYGNILQGRVSEGYSVLLKITGFTRETFSGSSGINFLLLRALLPIRAYPGIFRHLPPSVFTI